ncbi:choice-of-anchor L domain-containing protein, partial [Flavobacterium sp.]|uniref:choice-of-anchor L domain-containing protein n=1 Tax=Flavobacterium sp. TaxID=239 RepID=UPI002FDDC052
MKRILLSLLLIAGVLNSYSQAITVNTTTYTVPQLVQDVLFSNPSGGTNSCVGTISNITWSTGTNFSSTNGIGYFQNTNPNFPLNSGVILSTGNVMNAPGPNNSTLSDGGFGWPGDNQLFNYIQGLGIDPGLTSYNNATVLEFDFTPLTNQMSFDFLFVSEEYGTFQCTFSDAFAFFLTNVTAGTPPTNLALVPSTTTPISVITIRDNAFNGGCPSVNPGYFGSFNGPPNDLNSATDFNGETVLMTATSAVIPNNVYHIKLVIADRNDNALDSAVFLGAGSFDIGSANITGTGQYDGLGDFSGTNAICASEALTIQASTTPIVGATYSWTFNTGTIPGATGHTLDVTQEGEYCVTITYPSGCQQTDCVIVEYIPGLDLGTPNDLTVCANPFDLTQNTPVILNGLSNTLTFHHTLFEAQELIAPISNPSNYIGFDGEIIYAAVEDDMTGCIAITQFTLHINPLLCTSDPIPNPPPTLTLCENSFGSGTANFDFTPQTAIVLGTYPAADYTVSYHLSQNDANNDINAINPITSFSGTNGQTIYVRLEDNSDPTSFGTTSFQLVVNPLPTATISGTTSICSGNNTVITFNGTPNATVTYTVDGSPNQTIVLNGAGTNTVTTPNLTANSTYTLVSVLNNTTNCTRAITGSAVVTVNPLPTVTISGTTSICSGNTAVITFTGTPNAVVTYNINSNPNQTVTLSGTGIATLTTPVLTSSVTYNLVSVVNPATTCSQTQTGSAIVTVVPLPFVAISGTATICSGDSTTISFNGSPFTTVTYTVNNGPNQTITTDASGSAGLLTGPLTVTTTYTLVSVQDGSGNTPACGQPQTGSATVTVNTAP